MANHNDARGRPDIARRAVLVGTGAATAMTAAALATSASAQPASSNALNVRDFGAAGDGANDDSGAIIGAIDSVSADGGELFFPPGVYRARNLNFAGRARYRGVPGASVLSLAPGARFLGAVDRAQDVEFSGLTFNGDGQTPFEHDALVTVSGGAQRVTFDNCTLRDCANHGLLIDESACRISNCLLERVADFAIKAETAEPVQIVGSTIRDIGN